MTARAIARLNFRDSNRGPGDRQHNDDADDDAGKQSLYAPQANPDFDWIETRIIPVREHRPVRSGTILRRRARKRAWKKC